jgi:aspartate racemase
MGMQKEVMDGIYAIKGGKSAKGFMSLSTVANKLIGTGAEAIIAGCTEIPLVLRSSDEMIIIDPTEILAKTIIKIANETGKSAQLV